MQTDTRNQQAIAAIFRRMNEMAAQCGEKFPLFRAEPDTQWTLSKRGSWMGGFWAGLWWLKASVTINAADRAQAARWCMRLEALLNEPSVNSSFVFWYGAGLGGRLLDDEPAGQLAQRAARTLRDSFDEALAVWPLGEGMGAGESGRCMLDVDSLAPLISLMHAHGGSMGRTLAQRYLDSCLTHLADEAGAWRNRKTLGATQEMQAPKIWPRGQAWAMLGLAEAARRYGTQRYADAALLAAAIRIMEQQPARSKRLGNCRCGDASLVAVHTKAAMAASAILSASRRIIGTGCCADRRVCGASLSNPPRHIRVGRIPLRPIFPAPSVAASGADGVVMRTCYLPCVILPIRERSIRYHPVWLDFRD